MSTDSILDPTVTLAGLTPDAVPDGYAARGLDHLSDGALVDLVAAAVARPKVAAADSFVLHAPLELLARAALLPLVEPAARERARQRLVWLGASYQAAGEEVADLDGRDLAGHASEDQLLARLDAALAAGELDDADRTVAALAATLAPAHLSRALADPVLPRLAAAAHGNILLFQLPRIAPRSRVAASACAGRGARAGPPPGLGADLARPTPRPRHGVDPERGPAPGTAGRRLRPG